MPSAFDFVEDDSRTASVPIWKRLLKSNPFQTFLAAILAVLIGMLVVNTAGRLDTSYVKLIGILGSMWFTCLKAVVLPLIMSSMINSVYSLKHIKGAGPKLAKVTIAYYAFTTMISSIQGLILCVIFVQPNLGPVDMTGMPPIDSKTAGIAAETSMTIMDQIRGLFLSLLPSNIVKACAENELLAIIVTAMVLGALIEDTPEKPSAILRFSREIETMVFKIMKWLIMFTPIGVFFLILPLILTAEFGNVLNYIMIYIGGAYIGLAFHMLITLPLCMFIFSRENPYTFMLSCHPAMITALGTSSSAASLPVTMECAKKNGIPIAVCNFALPLGCTISMDGSAIAFPVMATFISATQGIILSSGQIVMMCLMCTLASVGASPIPSGGLVLLILILQSLGIPVTPMFGYLIATEWIIDRPLTMVNVIGDLIASKIVSKFVSVEKEEMEESI